MLMKPLIFSLCLSAPSLVFADDALDQLDQATAQMHRNMEQIAVIHAYQERLLGAMKEDEGALVGRTLPDGLCLDGMGAICALFPATFGTWGQGGE